jgi:ribosome-associated toxin RatA of RatAB toxin-antitoxin module
VLATITTIIFNSRPASAENFDSFIKPIFSPLKVSLQEEKVVLNGNNGEYLGTVIVRGSIKTIWNVLTDYQNYKDFMPNVIESRLLKSNHNQKTFEQVQIFKVLVAEKKGRVRIEVTENYPKELKFRVTEGDVKSLEGFWQIKMISSNLFLLTHKVSVEPNIKSAINRNLFFSIYEDTLENTLIAVKQEVEKRSHIY